MKTETPMDGLLQRLYDMNDLADMRQTTHDTEDDTLPKKKKKTGKSGDGFLGTVVNEILFRRGGKDSYVSCGEPSDGHPQEELTPDFQLFRGFQHNNATWTLYWPELII